VTIFPKLCTKVDMREQLQSKLEELKKDFSAGQARLADLQNQEASLNQQLLRISGAILVLQELIEQNPPGGKA